MSDSLKDKTLKGVFWTLLDNIGIRALSFISMLFLARWLGPEEFGLVGMISVFIALGQALVVSGMTTSLIRTKNANAKDYNTVFIINIVMSVIVYIVIYTIAPYISDFYEEQQLTKIIRVYAIVFLFTAFGAVQSAILNKNMDFKRLALLGMPSTVIGTLVGLFMGYKGYGVWSVIVLYLTTEGVRSVLLWAFSQWKPRFQFSKEKFKIHYGFGYKLMLSTIISTIFQNSYNIIIGKMYAAKTLGYFERSKRFSQYPSESFTGIMLKVTYPLLSALQDSPEQLASIYRKILRIAFFVIAPVMLGLAAIAKPLFGLVLGPQWVPAVQFFQILCLAMMLYPIHAFNLNILNVYGRSDLFLKLEIIKKIIVTLSILVAFQFGVIGLVWSSVFTSFAALGVNMFYSSKLINYSITHQVKDILITFVMALATAVVMFCVTLLLDGYRPIFQIIGALFCGGVMYLGVNYTIKKSPLHEGLSLLKSKNI